MVLTYRETDDDLAALHHLEGELAEVCGHLNALHARLVELTAQALAADAWAQWGIHTPSHWLAWKAGLSRSQARTLVRLAARRHELPVTMAAFAAGELSVDQVAPIAAKVPAWAEAQVCELATTATVTQLRAVVAGYPFTAEVPPAEDPTSARSREPEVYVSLTPRDDGTYRLTGLLDHDHGLLVDAALREARDALFTTTGTPASNLDALAEVAHRSLDTIEGSARRDRYRLHLHLDTTGHATDAHGRHVPDWIRRLAGCDPTTTPVWETHGRPIALGPPHTDIPAAVRRHVLRRDHATCRVPGCPSRRVDLHHVVHREDGGNHDPDNLAAICPRHHRLHHQGRLGITGHAEPPDGLVFTDHHGQPLPLGPTIRPPGGPPPPPSSTYRHPVGERLQRWAVTFTPPHPVLADSS